MPATVCPLCGSKTSETLGSRLHALRAERGLSLREVAKVVDIDPGCLWDIEHYDVEPVDYMLKRLMSYYGVAQEK